MGIHMIDWEQKATVGKKCNRCGRTGLNWDNRFHDKTGKWKLEDHRVSNGDWCNKAPEVMMMRTREECRLCSLCADSSFGLIKSTNPIDMDKHMNLLHPNGEIMTELDYKMSCYMPLVYLNYWTNDPHFSKYQHLLK
jgi:hypothetical protein